MYPYFPAVILLLLLVIPALPVVAEDVEVEDEWYEIELIVFEHKTPPGVDAEAWASDPGHPDIGPAIELAPSRADVVRMLPTRLSSPPLLRLAYQQLDSNERTLGRIADQLANSPDYAPLIHLGWRQPLAAERDSPPVRIHNLTDDEAEQPTSRLPASALFIDTRAVRAPVPATSGDRPPVIDGIVRIQRNRFVHVHLDLLMREIVEDTRESGLIWLFRQQATEPRAWRLQNQRRIRLDEVHYFDHPVFGVIVRVSRSEGGDQ